MTEVVEADVPAPCVLNDSLPSALQPAGVDSAADKVGEDRGFLLSAGSSGSQLEGLFLLSRAVSPQQFDPELTQVDGAGAALRLGAWDDQTHRLPVNVAPAKVEEFALAGAGQDGQAGNGAIRR
ncbi:MAG TPA: hypothetical protein VFS30_16080 [Dehalococcoidia bacterium]|nr:hypothetical protein [Dehalococcoidia bacterium]